MSWLRRWNFIDRARQERLLWEAFERGDDLEACLEACAREAEAGDAEAAFRLSIWRPTLERIRRMETLMAGRRGPGGES
jgi:hypothetical protein